MKLFQALGTVCLCMLPLRADTVLVLPFFNASKTPNLDWIGESISETIRAAAASQGLMALDREDRQEAFRRLGVRLNAHPTRATVLKIAQVLDADQVVYGDYELVQPAAGVTTTRGSLKITTHILDLKRTKQGPEFAETNPIEELGAAQSRVAWQTLRFLAPASTPSEAEFKRRWPQVRLDAIENYIRGLLATNADQKQRLFLQAFHLEPGFSDAAYQLGLLAYSRKEYRQAADWLQKVSRSDIHFRFASFHLGVCRFYLSDYAGAQQAFETVAQEVPLNEVFNNLGAAMSRRNQPAALENFQKAIEGDASDPIYHFNAGVALWRQGKFDEAADRFRAVLERAPRDTEATIMLGRCVKKTGPKPADANLERIKTNYEEGAYWQLKAVLQPSKP